MFKKSFSLIILSLFIFININISEVSAIKIVSKEILEAENKKVNLGDMFTFFGKMYDNKIPESYKYIDLKIKGINKNTEIYKNIQKLIYVDVLKNNPVKLNLNKTINAFAFYSFAEKNYNISLIRDSEINNLKSRKAIFKDFKNIKSKLNITKNSFSLDNNGVAIGYKKQIFSDVFKTISSSHYNRDNIDKSKMIDEAIKALAKGSGDKYTTYFPPVDNKNFNEALTGEYEGIGAYVEMETPGVFKIVSPLADSPAEASGLKGGDIVTFVDDHKVTDKNGIGEVVSWIKGPAGTSVILTVKRGNKTIKIEVIRKKIIIKEIESKKINSSTLYIQMKFFGPNISKEFTKSLEILKTDKNIKKIIFDLRGNGGGYLDEVSNMLGHFVPKGEATAVVKYYNSESSYKSRGYDDIDFSKYKLIALQNGGTASASEIFIGTLKDYFPKTTIIGEQSYGKGSVQTIKSYRDGSSLKYTIAKWYTGKSVTGINGVGITPDFKIEMEKYGVDESKDIQLQKALRLR